MGTVEEEGESDGEGAVAEGAAAGPRGLLFRLYPVPKLEKYVSEGEIDTEEGRCDVTVADRKKN